MNPFTVVNVFSSVFKMKHLLLIDFKLPFYSSLLTAPVDQSHNSVLSCMDKNLLLKIISTAVNRTVILVYNTACIFTDRWFFSLIYSVPLSNLTFSLALSLGFLPHLVYGSCPSSPPVIPPSVGFWSHLLLSEDNLPRNFAYQSRDLKLNLFLRD